MSKNEMKVKSYRYRQRRVDECYDMIEEQERLKQVIDVTQIMQIIYQYLVFILQPFIRFGCCSGSAHSNSGVYNLYHACVSCLHTSNIFTVSALLKVQHTEPVVAASSYPASR